MTHKIALGRTQIPDSVMSLASDISISHINVIGLCAKDR